MTTAHKPTWHAAIGQASQGGYRYHAPRVQYSSRDIAAHTTLKVRQIGQNAPSELQVRDFKQELKDREEAHKQNVQKEQTRAGLIPFADQQQLAIKHNALNKDEEDDDLDRFGTAEGNQGEEGGEVKVMTLKDVNLSQFDDEDDDESSSSDDEEEDDDDDDSDDEAELMRELERIKKEKEAEKIREALEKQKEEEAKETTAILKGNPLLQQESVAIKRRWDDDVVFKNQTRDEPKLKKRFVNDALRSDFHRSFMRKYVK